MKLAGAIFDLDGVVVDTAKFHYLAWKELAAELGFDFTPEDGERIKGVSRMAALDVVLGVGHVELPEREKETLADKKNARYVAYLDTLSEKDILPGVAAFIEGLKERGVRTAIGSASKNTPFILKKLGLDRTFDAVADGNVVTKAKPDPEVFVTAARMIGLEPARCAVFEDAIAGVEAANRGGMVSFGVGSAEVLTEAAHVIPDFTNYEALLQCFDGR